MTDLPPSTRSEVVRQLTEQVRQIERGGQRPPAEGVSSGCLQLDRLLPQGVFPRGALVEWLGEGPASGASTLALLLARQACLGPGAVVVFDRRGDFYPPAAACLGIDLERLLLVRPANERDERWAMDQALRSLGVAAVVAWPERLDARVFRRWQLAAEAGKALGLLVRPARARRDPSWAEARLLVEPRPGSGRRRLQVEVLHARGSQAGKSVELEIDDETGALHLATELAAPTTARRPSRA